MNRDVPTGAALLGVARRRWSPRAFDGRAVTADQLSLLFEAARWSPSAYNEQPWRFAVATREDPAAFADMLSCLNEWNRGWAHGAGAILAVAARLDYTHNGKANAHARYDAGQAAAWLTAQAVELGLQVHQMAGFSAERAREVIGVPAGFEPVAFMAIGGAGDPSTLPEAMAMAETAPRIRRPTDETFFGARWGEPWSADQSR